MNRGRKHNNLYKLAKKYKRITLHDANLYLRLITYYKHKHIRLQEIMYDKRILFEAIMVQNLISTRYQTNKWLIVYEPIGKNYVKCIKEFSQYW